MEKFTKGPWVVTETPSGKAKITDYSGFSLCHLNTGTTRQQKINAALIAAAPEMYEVLKKLKEYIINRDADADLSYVDVLLAKARGEQ